jgi:hypothetical protein
MENVAALQRIAEKLLPNPYFCRHNISFLQVLVRDEGRCVYCKRDLFESHDIASEVDHLLPRSLRSDLWGNAQNLVASCHECSQLKHDWIPCAKIDLRTVEGRECLIKEAAEHIRSKKQRQPDWKEMFPEAQTRLRHAIEEYQRTRSTQTKLGAA